MRNLDPLKLRNFHIFVKSEATVDDLCGYVFIGHRMARERCFRWYDTYLREVSALVARSTKMGNAKASMGESGQQVRLSRFSFIHIA